jgi:hypothetical protein
MNQGAAHHAIPECWNDIGVGHTRKLVVLLWETLDVISEGLTYLLLAALQILGAARTHICALEVVGEDLLEILPAIDDVSRQMVQPGPRGISQVDGEEMDDKEVIVHSAHSTHEALIL